MASMTPDEPLIDGQPPVPPELSSLFQRLTRLQPGVGGTSSEGRLRIPAPRPGLLEEYEEYLQACDEYNRQRLAEMAMPIEGVTRPVYANMAPRCEHVRPSGLRCQAPALRGRKLCYAHTRMAATVKAGLKLPPLEDAGGIALASMQIVQQLLDGKLDRKTATVALYGIQIVASTLRHKPFSATPTSIVLEAAGLPPEEELEAGIDRLRSATGSQPETSEQKASGREL